MSRFGLTLAASLILVAACSDRRSVTPPDDSPFAPPTAPPAAATQRPEHLARLVARALARPEFRASLRASLDASPFREHKLHFQRLLETPAGGTEALQAIAAANGIAREALAAEAAGAIPLEIYLPVPSHRAAWSGDEHVLVATALRDGEAPVAFDTRGQRTVLDPDVPPATPVIALVPVETDFSPGAARLTCYETCGGEGGGGGSGGGGVYQPSPGLYMTKAHFVDDFEGWLKGSPEFEVHMLGQLGQADSLATYQCVAATAAAPYYFDQNGKDWTGSVMLFSAAQLAAYNTAHPSQNLRVFVLEDDDTACQIKADRDLVAGFFDGVDAAFGGLTAGNDSSGAAGKAFKRAPAFQKLWASLTTLIKTNDELVGNAVEDAVTVAAYPGFNWIVKGKNNVTNGWINLEMR